MKSSKGTPMKKVRTAEEEKAFDVEMARHTFEQAEKNLEDYVDNMVERAERLVDDLKRNRQYFMEKKEEGANNSLMTRAGSFRSALKTVQNCFNNFNTEDAARFVSAYEKTDVYYKMMKGEKVNVW